MGLVCALVVHASLATAQAVPPPRIDVPAVPANLEVPAGHKVFLRGYAVGTQNYVCLPTALGPAWRFLGPQATLYQVFKGEPRQQITTHYLSADASEQHVARPTWQHSLDSSRVWGRLVAASADSAFVEPGAINWLLLEAAITESGHEGGDTLTDTTYIQRVNTSGGIAPATGCSDPGHVGAVALVPYSTDYFFYRAAR
jgi:hypothetical protein